MLSGEFLKKLRMIKGLNQNGIAIGITQQAYSKLEKSRQINEQKFKIVIKRCNALIKTLNGLKITLLQENSNLRFPSGIICKSP